MFSYEFWVIFKNMYMPDHLWTATKEVTNLERPTDYSSSKENKFMVKQAS